MAAGANAFFGPRKTIDETLASTELETHKLRRNLGTFDVIVLGIGAMVGAGIFVLTGQAAATEAGPSITLSFALAGVVCALAALCYAELAAAAPAAGAAHPSPPRRAGGDGAGRRQRLHLHVRDARPAHRVHHRLGPRARVHDRRVG